MGINGLWDAVSAAGVSCRVEHLRGKRVAIDASFWIIHCLASEANSRLGNDVYGVFFRRICYLLENRIFPIFVFDGRSPEAKKRTHLRRKMEREKRTRNLKLLAFKALAVQMKHFAKDANDRVFKPISFMKKKDGISERELEKIADDMESFFCANSAGADAPLALDDVEHAPLPQEEALFSSDDDFEDIPAPEITDAAIPVECEEAGNRVDILTMPRSYRALKMLSRTGVNVDLTGARPNTELDDAYFERYGGSAIRSHGSSRSRNLVELPIDCSINKACYSRLPGEVRYQIMQQIKDAWMYEDRVNLLQLKSSLSEFSNLQVDSYLRDVEINREIEDIKRVLIKDMGVKGCVKTEDGLNLEGVNKESLDGEIFDYNSVEARSRRKRRFLNDLSVDMQPDLYNMPLPRAVKPEDPVLDDSAFVCDSEIFGDLLASESHDEFEILDEREPSSTSKDPICETTKGVETSAFQIKDEWEVEEEVPVVQAHCKLPGLSSADKHLEVTTVKCDPGGRSLHHDKCMTAAEAEATGLAKHCADGVSSSSTSDYDSDPSYDPRHGGLDMSPVDSSSCTALSVEHSASVSSAEFISSDSEASSESYLEVEDDDSDELPSSEDEAYDLTDPEGADTLGHHETGQPASSDSTTTDQKATSQTFTGSVSECTSVHVDSAVDGFSDPLYSGSSAMYRNDSEYRDYLRMEKLLSRADRSQYRLEDWDKVPLILDLFGVPYMVAPSEAEAQCAHLNNTGLCFGVISDDSDTIAFGASRVFKNFYSGNVFEVYISDRIVSELGLAQEQLALLAIICGCDYTEGVHGIGVVNALEVIKAYPTFEDLYEFRRWATSECDFSKVTEDECPIRRDYKVAHVNYRLHWSFCSDFPNREAYNLLLHPRVSSTFEPEWRAPRYEEILRFMESNSSLPASEVSMCLSKLQSGGSFDGFILEDFVPEIHASSSRKSRRSVKSKRKILRERVQSFRAFLKSRSERKSRKAGARQRALDSVVESAEPVAFIRSKRMLNSIEGIKEYVHSRKAA
ncbi:putative Rad2 endonuclease [Babesia divergens]|uniref:Rad2 endonuclease n=1 Tax=Babesia divergens TaxID=32595 RepID=A0AAD9G924_BABDI|nr:putative Rad2 endonuclease [Babesia divergens]